MTGRLTIVGLGPGPSDWMTGAVQTALDDATDLLDGGSARWAGIIKKSGITLE